MNRTEKIMKDHLEMPPHKITYIIRNKSLVEGLWGHLHAYGIPFTTNNHRQLVSIVEEILEDTVEIEHEWTEDEYNNFVCYKNQIGK